MFDPATMAIVGGTQLASTALGGIEAYKNFSLQKRNLQYQKELQNTLFQREDNAVQRRAADLQAAGLSKTLAAGSAASAGPVVSTTDPQMDLKGLGNLQNAMNALQIQNVQKQMEATDADISKTHAEQKAIEATTRKTKADAWGQEMINDYTSKSGIPSNVSTPAKIIRDAVPLLQNSAKEFERSHQIPDEYKLPFGTYKYGFPK